MLPFAPSALELPVAAAAPAGAGAARNPPTRRPSTARRCCPPPLTAPPCPARRCRISSVSAAPDPGRHGRPHGAACPGPSAGARRHRWGRAWRRCRPLPAAPSSSSRTRKTSSSRGTVPPQGRDGGRHAAGCGRPRAGPGDRGSRGWASGDRGAPGAGTEDRGPGQRPGTAVYGANHQRAGSRAHRLLLSAAAADSTSLSAGSAGGGGVCSGACRSASDVTSCPAVPGGSRAVPGRGAAERGRGQREARRVAAALRPPQSARAAVGKPGGVPAYRAAAAPRWPRRGPRCEHAGGLGLVGFKRKWLKLGKRLSFRARASRQGVMAKTALRAIRLLVC